MTGRTILFGVGATKAGTSWLHRWLSGHPECRFRTLKELHYFDAVAEGRTDRRIATLKAERAALAQEGVKNARLRDIDEFIEVLEAREAGAYLSYLAADAENAMVVGDVTPAYSLLSVERLREMAGLGETRFLYILRDPVARLWSHVRMTAGRREPSGEVTAERAARILKRTIRGDEEEIARRSDYRSALQRLAAAVPERQRLVVFFEHLFNGTAVAEISDWLGIRRTPVLEQVVHAGQPLRMTEAQAAAAREWLRDQYDYVIETKRLVPAAWAERMT